MKRKIEMNNIKVVRTWLRGWWRPTFAEGKGKRKYITNVKRNGIERKRKRIKTRK